MEALYSKKDYQNLEGGLKGKYRNGVFKGSARGSYTNGQTYSRKFGNIKVTAGKKDKYFGKGGIEFSNKGVKAKALVGTSTIYKGCFQAGKVKVRGYTRQARIVNGSANANKHDVNFKWVMNKIIKQEVM